MPRTGHWHWRPSTLLAPVGTACRYALGLLILGALACPLTGRAAADQRQQFLAAEQALKQGRFDDYRALKAQLGHYPLYPYLEYAELRRGLSHASNTEVRGFLEQQHDTPLAGLLRSAWLRHLAKQGRWQDYLDYYAPSTSVTQRCTYLNALIKTGHTNVALEQAQQLWLVGESQPKECDPLFEAWIAAGRLTPQLTWERIELAMDDQQTGLAGYLRRFLPAASRPSLDYWLRVHRDPDRLLEVDAPGSLPAALHQKILLHGLERLARNQPRQAREVWEKLQHRHPFTQAQRNQAVTAIGLGLARISPPEGLNYLDRILTTPENLRVQEKRLRIALRQQDWERVLAWIDALPEARRGEEGWRYWRARALGQLEREQDAREILQGVARERSYYGFLAADRIGAKYKLTDTPVAVDPERLDALARSASVQRAFELLALGRPAPARREWYWLTRDLDAAGLQAAAKLAQQRQWHDQAIFTLAKTGYWDDLELRFPLEYRDHVMQQATSHGLDPAWIYAVLRQESAFAADARSPAGALGLMQLMPKTAQGVAKRQGQPRPGRYTLLRPRVNIRLGSAYLAQMCQRFNRQPVLATAAYNAGPHRVDRWYPDRAMDADIWVATIPFRETRTYVRRVMSYRILYQDRLGLRPASLASLMPPIGKETSRVGVLARCGGPAGATGGAG